MPFTTIGILMITTTKSSLLAVILHTLGSLSMVGSIAMTTLTMYGMEKPEPRLIDVIQDPFSYNNHTIHLTGEIQLRDNAIIGYGNEGCINALTDVNIEAKQQWPLVPVNVFIPNPKKEPNANQTYTDWTEQTPLVIKEEIFNFTTNQIDKEKKRVASLYGHAITPENKKIWGDFYSLSAIIESKATKNKSLVIPAVIPVNILLSSAININFFKTYQTSLKFNQHEKLEKLMNNFNNIPQATFTMLDAKTTLNIQQRAILSQSSGHEMYADQIYHLEQKILTNLYIQTNITNQKLEEKNILNGQDKCAPSHDLDLISPTLAISTIENYTHGDNGYSKGKFRNLLLENELKGKNPITYTNNRAITGKK